MSDQGYIISPIDTDPPAIAQRAFDYLAFSVPGWVPAPGNLDTLIIEALSEEIAENAEVASAVTQSVFRSFGSLVGVPPLAAAPAGGVATFTARDTAGYTVLGGTIVGLRNIEGALVAFTLDDDLVIPAGSASADGAVTAEVEGEEANELSGLAEPINVPAFISTVTFTNPTAGGIEAEDDDLYRDRLSETLTLLSPRPILPRDFAVLSRSIAGVYRATAVDLLKPGPPYSGTAAAAGQPRTVTVAITDVAGNAVGPAVRAAVDAYLQSLREQNFAVYVVDPVYADVAVTTTVQAWPGYDTAAVAASVQTAIRDYLSPSTWGSGQTRDPRDWYPEQTVRLGELYQYINAVEGVRYVTALTLGLSGGTMGTADVDISGGQLLPALPRAGAGTTAGTGINVTALAG